MLIVYLVFGMLFGTAAAVLAVANGGGVLMAVLAYSSGGALAMLAPLLVQFLFGANDIEAEWQQRESESRVSA